MTGKEFTSLKSYFAKKEIILTYKYGQNKASFAEHAIYLVKSRLFKLLRSKLSDDWPKYLKFVVDALNERPLERIGFKKPSEINSLDDNIVVQEAWKNKNITPFEEPSWKNQAKNEKNYEKSKNPFKVGTFVYLDQKNSIFDKSFYLQVCCYFTS